MDRNRIYQYLASLLIVLSVVVFGCRQGATASEDAKGMSTEEAAAALAPLLPQATIISVAPSAIEGLWEVVIDNKGEKGILYVDASKKYLVGGSIIEISTRTNITKAKFEDINRVDFSSIPLGDALVLGNPKAAYRAVVFDDPD
jgi:thiol:disulfide interchange protein DsbC